MVIIIEFLDSIRYVLAVFPLFILGAFTYLLLTISSIIVPISLRL